MLLPLALMKSWSQNDNNNRDEDLRKYCKQHTHLKSDSHFSFFPNYIILIWFRIEPELFFFIESNKKQLVFALLKQNTIVVSYFHLQCGCSLDSEFDGQSKLMS